MADLKDEITRRVVDLQRDSGAVAAPAGRAGAADGRGATGRRRPGRLSRDRARPIEPSMSRDRTADGPAATRPRYRPTARERNAHDPTPEGPAHPPPPARQVDARAARPARRARRREPGTRATLAGAAVAAGFLGLIFWKNIVHFGLSWSTDENYSHGFLVPLISPVLRQPGRRARAGPASGAGRGSASALLAGALLVKLATVVVVVGTLGDLALIVGDRRAWSPCWRGPGR